MFNGIESWLSLENEDVPLDQYLLNEGLPENEVQLFREQHLAGLQGPGSARYKSGGSQQQQGCACNAIMPTSLVLRNNSSPSGNDNRKTPPTWLLGKFKAHNYYWASEGLSTDFRSEVNSHITHSEKIHKQNGGASVRITNLCTNDAYFRDDLCNCDKFVEYDGEFRNNIENDLDHNSGTLNGSKAQYAFKAAYLLYKSEYNPDGLGLTPSKSEILDSAYWKVAGHQEWSIDWNKAADAYINLLEAAVNVIDTNFADIPGNLSDFFSNFLSIANSSIENSQNSSSYSRPFTGVDTLKANVPHYFVALHSFSSHVATQDGGKNLARIKYKSAFYWTFRVANSDQGFNIQGEPVGNYSDCCNEDWAVWDFHNTLNSDLSGGILQMASNMYANLHNSAFSQGPFFFDNTSYGPSIIQNGYVDIMNNENLYLNSSTGEAYSLDQCLCETFLILREDPETGIISTNVLTPKLNLTPDILCPGNSPTLYINNAEDLNTSGCEIDIRVTHETAGLIYSTAATGINLQVNLTVPGVYTVSYIDNCTGCMVSRQINLRPCVTSQELSCIWDYFNIFPNPLPPNYEELNLGACLANCLEDPTDITALSQLHSQYFPATLEIRNSAGALVYGPQTNVLSSGTLNQQNNCYEEIISLNSTTLAPSFPFPSGIYVLIVNFANGGTKHRYISIP